MVSTGLNEGSNTKHGCEQTVYMHLCDVLVAGGLADRSPVPAAYCRQQPD